MSQFDLNTPIVFNRTKFMPFSLQEVPKQYNVTSFEPYSGKIVISQLDSKYIGSLMPDDVPLLNHSIDSKPSLQFITEKRSTFINEPDRPSVLLPSAASRSIVPSEHQRVLFGHKERPGLTKEHHFHGRGANPFANPSANARLPSIMTAAAQAEHSIASPLVPLHGSFEVASPHFGQIDFTKGNVERILSGGYNPKEEMTYNKVSAASQHNMPFMFGTHQMIAPTATGGYNFHTGSNIISSNALSSNGGILADVLPDPSQIGAINSVIGGTVDSKTTVPQAGILLNSLTNVPLSSIWMGNDIVNRRQGIIIPRAEDRMNTSRNTAVNTSTSLLI